MDLSRQAIKEALPPQLRARVRDVYGRVRRDYYPFASWSQGGEDMLVRDLVGQTNDGFFVDVGAFHPRFGSNTYALYKRGWRGINIDARPGSMDAFKRARSEDTNLEVAISTTPGSADFHVFFEEELSTLDTTWAEEQLSLGHKRERIVRTPVRTLADIHAEYAVPADYDLLSVDAEGHDEEVLRSNDWDRYRPRLVIVECSHGLLFDALETSPARFMREVGYQPAAATRLSVIFRSDTPAT